MRAQIPLKDDEHLQSGLAWLGRRPGLTAAALGFFAGAIGLINAWNVSMWVDEAYTVSVATRTPQQIWQMAQNIDAAHALFNLMLHPWFAAFGVSEMTVRLPSAACIVAATGVLFLLVRGLAGTQLAVTSALIFALLPRTTWMAMEGRSYAFTTVLAITWTWLFVRIVQRANWVLLLGYAILGAITISVHIFLVLMLAVHGAVLLVDPGRRLRLVFWQWLGAALLALTGGAPVLLMALKQSSQIGASAMGVTDLVRSLAVNQWFLGGTPTVSVSSGKILDDGGLTAWKVTSVVLALVCLGLAAWGVSLQRRTILTSASDRPSPATLAACWTIIPSLLTGVATLAGSSVYNPRYLAFTTPGVAVLIGIGLLSLGLSVMRVVTAAVLLCLVAPIYLSQRTEHAKSGSDWLQVADFVRSVPGENRAVYFAARDIEADGDDRTSRTAQVLYPDAFRGITDLTLLRSPVENNSLYATNRPLRDAAGQLASTGTVFAIYRVDVTTEAVQADAGVFGAAGLTETGRWRGPLNTVLVYTRS